MSVERIPTCCALCISRCGCIAVVEDGRLARIEPDPRRVGLAADADCWLAPRPGTDAAPAHGLIHLLAGAGRNSTWIKNGERMLSRIGTVAVSIGRLALPVVRPNADTGQHQKARRTGLRYYDT